MPLVATVGASNANAYLTEVEATTYFSERRLYDTEWTVVTIPTRERALIWATKLLDLAMDWYGYVVTSTQALRWPRSGTYTIDGVYIPHTDIPTIVKEADAELALALIRKDRTLEPELLGQGFSSARVGSLSVDVDPTQVLTWLPAFVVAQLSHLGDVRFTGGQQGDRFVPLVRV